MLAVICALKEWRCNLEGAQFTIVTDHQLNTYLDVASSAHTLKRRARWLDVACGYDYTWCYRPSRVNVADPMSRAPQHFAMLAPVVAGLRNSMPAAEQALRAICCAVCNIKLIRAARHAAAANQDAGAVSADRRVPGLHTPDGGG